MDNQNALYTASEIEEIYFELTRAYGSRYHDNREELKDAVLHLATALNVRKVPKELLVSKLKEMMFFEDSDYKTKMSTLILNRYWERNYRPEVSRKIFNPD